METTKPKSDRREILLVNNRIQSRDLFYLCKELTIVHNDEEYTLRLTGNGKLLLTK